MSGELIKMKIEAYKSNKFSASDRVDEFVLLFNPTTYDETWEVSYIQNESPGNAYNSQKFTTIKPQKYIFDFILDGTGTAGPKIDVGKEIDRFLKLTAQYNGDIHRPLYCKISWGRFIFRCILTTATITYSMFKPDGTPLRATIKATFSEYEDLALQAARRGKNSPDLTHQRTVVRGDTLPLMAYRIYGDMAYYQDVARYNHLRGFRQLKAGMKIMFPPLNDLKALKERA